MPPAAAYFVICLVIAVATAIIYSNTLHNPFLFDDLPNILENPHVRMQSISTSKILTILKMSGNRPLPALSFALNYYFGAYHPVGYHIVNILIHAVTGICFFFFVNMTIKHYVVLNGGKRAGFSSPASALAFAAALLWVVHPVNTQSVTYIVQRMTSLATMFCLMSLILYATARSANGGRKIAAFIASLLLWLLAIASKESAAVLPFIIFLYEWYFFQNLSQLWLKKNLKYILVALGLFAIAAFIFLGADPIEKMKSLRDYAEGEFSLTERILTQFRVIVYYLSLFFYPAPSRLNLDYDFPLSYSFMEPPSTLFQPFRLRPSSVSASIRPERTS